MRPNSIILAVILLLSGICTAYADNGERTVTGEFTYYGDDNTTPKEARAKALERARLEALAREFGTTVTGTTLSDETIKGGEESTFFKSLSETEVKGEWIADIGEPEYKVSYDNDGNLVVYCKIRGRAKAISNDAPDFDVAILRNGAELRNADTRFRNGDDLRLYFKAPVDGYLAVYMCDDNRTAYTLLPYMASSDGCVKVKHGKEYIFFDSKLATPEMRGQVDELNMTTSDPVEHDRFYVIFSPKPFVKANDSFSNDNTPRSLSFNAFHKWLRKARSNDNTMAVKTFDVTIQGDEQ